MAFLSKLTLTKFKRSQTHQDPVLDRRAKVLNALAKQRDVLNVALADACGIALGCAVGVGLHACMSRFYC